MHPISSLVLGLVCAALGGESFVRGAVGLARWARIPAGIVGATVAAFATSSPELTVSINAARAGAPQVALGDALGSNVVNVGLILGLALLFGPMKGGAGSLGRDLPVALMAPVLTAVLLFDGSLSRLDGAFLLAAFALWLILTVRDAAKERSAAPETLSDSPRWQAVVFSAVGLGLLVLAGGLIVDGAKYVGASLGWSAFATGAILVSIGTSAPELATTIASRLRGHDDVGLGTVLGSNVFNGLFIVGVAASIHPIPVAMRETLVGLAFSVVAVAAAIPRRGRSIGRRRGFLLLGVYGAYLAFLLWRPWNEMSVQAQIFVLVAGPLALLLAIAGGLLRLAPEETASGR